MTDREFEYVEVPEEERLDVDDGEGADASESGVDDEDLDQYRILDAPIWDGT